MRGSRPGIANTCLTLAILLLVSCAVLDESETQHAQSCVPVPIGVLYIQSENRIVVETNPRVPRIPTLTPQHLPVRTRLPSGEIVDGLYPPSDVQLRAPSRPPPVWEIPTMVRVVNGEWIVVRVPGNLYTDGTVTGTFHASAKIEHIAWEGHPQYRVLVDHAIFPKYQPRRRTP